MTPVALLAGMTQATPLMCQSCPGRFGTPWSLLKHAQSVHALQIYLEQGVYSEGISGVGVLQEQCRSPSKKTLFERCALPRDEGVAVSATSPFTEVVHSALNSRDEGDSTDNLRVEEHCDLSTSAVTTLNVASARKKEVCCDSQECGISLMPITHEEPKKCCCAVVPKWRKRHMETKHMHGAGGDLSASTADKPRSPSIFIDLVPDVDSGKNAPEVRTMVESEDSEDSSSYSMTIVSENTAPPTMTTERSVIIQPGTSFSIPIRYTSPLTSEGNNHPPWQTITTSTLNPTQFTDLQLESSPQQSSAIPSASLAATTEVVQGESMEIEVESDSGNGMSGSVYSSGKKRRYPTSRPFKCDQCSNAFNQRIHLKKHLSKHTGKTLEK